VKYRLTLAAAFLAVLAPAAPAYAGNAQESLHSHTSLTTRAAASTYTVVSGDTLSRIAARYGTTWQNVWAANRWIANPNLIYPGWRLTIGGTAPAPVAAGWVNPVPGACISSGFGWRWGRMHWGVDLSRGYGAPIRAAAAGTVSVGYQASGAGNYTMINHGGGVWSVYMHQSSFAVRSGWVGAGQVIGYVGSTGNSTGPHLHLETHTGGLWSGRVNPVTFFSARGVRLGC
jgi:murein DD-endopeptidase MepM/ murein hydrolase activator NlpD